MRIALAQLNYHIGNFDNNAQKILEYIRLASARNTDLVIFSELSVCGYPPQDLLEHKDFIDKCYSALKHIAQECTTTAAIVGVPLMNENEKGKPLYNSACLLSQGKIAAIRHKTLLPTYDIFDEYRYFESNTQFETISFKGVNIALTICEDIWDQQPAMSPMGKSNLYTIAPMEKLHSQKPDIMINIAASPFAYNQVQDKRQIFMNNARKYQIPLIYVNQVGAQTELIFPGNSLVVNSTGGIIHEMLSFKEDFTIIETDQLAQMPMQSTHIDDVPITRIHDALILGLRDFFGKMNFNNAVLGLSGGIDSAVSLVLAERALGSNNVRALLMPSQYSSDHSVNDSIALANNLGVQYDIVSIENIFNEFKKTLQPLFQNVQEDITEENIQARARAILLMAISNKFGDILLNTSNKSEAAVGYGTLYGDMSGGLSVLGDVYKTDLYKLAKHINKDTEVIPENIITKPPSAELKPDQKDTDSLPDYELLDQILYRYIEEQKPVNNIIQEGFDETLVKKIVRLINQNEFKRYQAPPMLRISSKAFGSGRRMPLVAKYE
jgi:NAD+ synthase (glutamine-hydrolysing)